MLNIKVKSLLSCELCVRKAAYFNCAEQQVSSGRALREGDQVLRDGSAIIGRLTTKKKWEKQKTMNSEHIEKSQPLIYAWRWGNIFKYLRSTVEQCHNQLLGAYKYFVLSMEPYFLWRALKEEENIDS